MPLALAAIATAATAAALLAASAPSVVSGFTHRPEHRGQCFLTRVARVETRLVGAGDAPIRGSGSAIRFRDGHYNVRYEVVSAIERSRPGDRVRLCVKGLPAHCPAGDTRGISYRGTNLRTGRSWEAPDAEHPCDGA